MTIATKPTADELARKFSEILVEDIGRTRLHEVVRRNKKDAAFYVGCCASHDFCDANMTMLAAVENFGFSSDDVFENDCENPIQKLWNEAWDLAKSNAFYI